MYLSYGNGGGGNILLTYPSHTYIFRSQRPQTNSLYQNQRSLTCSAINYPVHTAYKLTLSSFFFFFGSQGLTIQSRKMSKSQSSCLSHPSSGIAGVYNHTWFSLSSPVCNIFLGWLNSFTIISRGLSGTTFA